MKMAFLYEYLEEEVYIEQPTGYTVDPRVCRLEKTLYDLKQSPRVWYTIIAKVPIKSESDLCTYKVIY